MKKIIKYSSLAAFGGVGYNIIEVLWRGYSHISMTFAGGISFLILYIINNSYKKMPLLLKSLLGGAAITVVEFISGVIVNIKMNLAVWNYSDRKFNLLGQICLLYSVLWVLLCIPVNLLLDKFRNTWKDLRFMIKYP